jgi:hypothetical protein
MMAYHVKQWDDRHETHESRKLVRLPWVAVPTKHDGLGYRNTVRQKNCNGLLAAWKLILEVAAKGDRAQRGWLVRAGKPLSAIDLATMTGLTEDTFQAALAFFVEPPSDWLELADYAAVAPSPGSASRGSPGVPAESAAVAPSPGSASRGSPGVPAESAAVAPSPGSASRGSPGVPAESAAVAPSPGSASRPSPAMAPVHNSTVQDSTEVQNRRERSVPGGSEFGAQVQASRTRAGVLLSQIRELERQGEELTPEERSELRKKRAALKDLQKKQADGHFAEEPRGEGPAVQTSGSQPN